MSRRRCPSLLALLALLCCLPVVRASDDASPFEALVGRWSGTADIRVDWCEQEGLDLDLTVDADGSVRGTLGGATLVGGRLELHSGTLGRAIGLASGYLLLGNLEGPLVEAEQITRTGVRMPFDLEQDRLAGTLQSTGSLTGSSRSGVFAARFEGLVRTVSDLGERSTVLAPRRFGEVPFLHTLEGVWFSGQPTAEDLQAAAEGGLATVLDLRHEAEHPFDEAAVVTAAGMAYLHVPFAAAGELTDEVLDTLRGHLREAQRPILLHCASANRVGAVWMAHRALDGGRSLEESLAEAQAIGLRTAAYHEMVADYVARHTDPSRSTTPRAGTRVLTGSSSEASSGR